MPVHSGLVERACNVWACMVTTHPGMCKANIFAPGPCSRSWPFFPSCITALRISWFCVTLRVCPARWLKTAFETLEPSSFAKMASETTDCSPTEAVKYISELRDFVIRGSTSVEWRVGQLKLLREVLQEEKEAMCLALSIDLCVDEAQALLFQIGCLFGEIDHCLDNIAEWSAMKRVNTPMVLQPASSYVQAQPKGVVLIIGAWNYPFVVTFGPMLTALAAGNAVIVKPSELSPHAAQVMHRICSRLDQRAVRCCLGGVELSTTLVSQPLDHIVYTGSTRVGRLIMAAAAPNLTPVTLELGGKSPVVICGGININEACRRIAVGKFVNCGQTCIAPDYILVERGVRDEVVAELKKVGLQRGKGPVHA